MVEPQISNVIASFHTPVHIKVFMDVGLQLDHRALLVAGAAVAMLFALLLFVYLLIIKRPSKSEMPSREFYQSKYKPSKGQIKKLQYLEPNVNEDMAWDYGATVSPKGRKKV